MILFPSMRSVLCYSNYQCGVGGLLDGLDNAFDRLFEHGPPLVELSHEF